MKYWILLLLTPFSCLYLSKAQPLSHADALRELHLADSISQIRPLRPEEHNRRIVAAQLYLKTSYFDKLAQPQHRDSVRRIETRLLAAYPTHYALWATVFSGRPIATPHRQLWNLAQQLKTQDNISRNDSIQQIQTTLKEKYHWQSLELVYQNNSFSSASTPWHWSRLEWQRKMNRVAVIARANWANRFETNGAQAELEAYLPTGRRSYIWVGAGAGDGKLFPDGRTTLEWFWYPPFKKNLSLELSAGVRALLFNKQITPIYTGSATWYQREKYNANGFMQPALNYRHYTLYSNGNYYQTFQLGYRLEWKRYLAPFGEYYTRAQAGIILAAGRIPYQIISTADLGRLQAYRGLFQWQLALNRHFYWKGFAGADYEEFRPGAYRWRYTAETGILIKWW